MKTNLSSQSL